MESKTPVYKWCSIIGLFVILSVALGASAVAEKITEATVNDIAPETVTPIETTAAPASLSGLLEANDPATQTAELMPRAVNSLMLDITQTEINAIAVGERGHILLSENHRDWRQVENVPTRSTLTAVTAVANKVWAVGHDGVILHSANSGETWVRQRVAPFNQDSDDLQNGAPLLDVYFSDEQNGFAIGAYSQLLVTRDGGNYWLMRNVLSKSNAEMEAQQAEDDAAIDEENWTFSQDDLALDEETDPHFNAITRTGDGSFFIVAERGAAFRSTDMGNTWQRLQMPYQGSMFGVIGFADRHVLCFGLRGNVYESFDLGETWRQMDTGTTLSLMGGTKYAESGVMLVGANGIILQRNKLNDAFVINAHPDGNVLSSVIAFSATEFAIAGETGMSVYSIKPSGEN